MTSGRLSRGLVPGTVAPLLTAVALATDAPGGVLDHYENVGSGLPPVIVSSAHAGIPAVSGYVGALVLRVAATCAGAWWPAPSRLRW